MNRSATAHSDARGFSLVELIVTVVLAGIIFAAMVPLFVNASKASGRDRVRNVAASAAQGRIDSIRLLSWSQLTDPSINTNLQSSTFAGGCSVRHTRRPAATPCTQCSIR